MKIFWASSPSGQSITSVMWRLKFSPFIFLQRNCLTKRSENFNHNHQRIQPKISLYKKAKYHRTFLNVAWHLWCFGRKVTTYNPLIRFIINDLSWGSLAAFNVFVIGNFERTISIPYIFLSFEKYFRMHTRCTFDHGGAADFFMSRTLILSIANEFIFIVKTLEPPWNGFRTKSTSNRLI